jgi:hypothetical protein
MKKSELKRVLHDVKRAYELIQDPRTEVICDFGTIGKKSINKQVGSDLVGLVFAIERLEEALSN